MAPIPFSEFRRLYLHVLSGPRYSPATKMKMAQVLRQLADLGVESTADLTTAKITDYAIARTSQVSANTVRGELTYLRAACNYAIEEEYLERGPRWRRVWPRKSRRKRKTVHSIEDIRHVLDYLDDRSIPWDGHRLYAAAALIAYTGLRRDEALWARVADVNLGTRIMQVVDWKRLKTAEAAAPVPLPPELIPILRQWIVRTRCIHLFPQMNRKGPWRGGSKASRPTARLVAAGIAVGVAGCTFQSLRHTFTTLGRRIWMIPPAAMRDILRHTSIDTHEEHYLHRLAGVQDLVDAVKNVSYR